MARIPGIDHEFDEVLSMDDPDFVENFKRALGIKGGEVLEIFTPQFDRTDGKTPAEPEDVWDRLNHMSPAALEALGCKAWDKPNKSGYQTWLFPAEWYDKIPKGFLITDINNEVEPFEPGHTDNDRRYGVLTYGIRIQTRNTNEQQI